MMEEPLFMERQLPQSSRKVQEWRETSKSDHDAHVLHQPQVLRPPAANQYSAVAGGLDFDDADRLGVGVK